MLVELCVSAMTIALAVERRTHIFAYFLCYDEELMFEVTTEMESVTQ
jgi:hypothetical protein